MDSTCLRKRGFRKTICMQPRTKNGVVSSALSTLTVRYMVLLYCRNWNVALVDVKEDLYWGYCISYIFVVKMDIIKPDYIHLCYIARGSMVGRVQDVH